MGYLNDIEDFPTDQLRAEIHRREQVTRQGRCWYCQNTLELHTCKHAKPSPVPGWVIKPPQGVSIEDCMGDKREYWQADGKHPVMNECVVGIGDSKQEATAKCIDNARKRQEEWSDRWLKVF